MSKRAIFRIDKGDFEQGFRVSLEIRDHQRSLLAGEVFGTLVPNSEILTKYQKWQQAYYAWGQDENCRWWRRKIDVPPSMNQNYSTSEDSVNRVKNAAGEFKTAFNNWLNLSLLEDIKWTLSQHVKEDEPVTFIVKTDNPELQKLPWELWRVSERYHHFQVALSSKKTPLRGELSFPVKILVILGSDENIDIETDWQILKNKLKPGAELIPLKQPKVGELKEKLRNQPWDIVFFAGHSATNSQVNDARIWLDDKTSLSPQDIEKDLRKAVRNGLKLAIFNSCDGLGLARQLDNLDIPHIIVMREPVHDKVAQKFLEHFLTSFAKGESLHRAVCEARENLTDLEDFSPTASWLPTIFQNPEEPPLFYPQSKLGIKKIMGWMVGAIALFTLVFGINKIIDIDKDSTRVSGISLGEEILSQNSTPEKSAGVKAFAHKKYSEAIANFKASLDKNPNDPEARIYLQNAKAASHKETIKIAISVPFGTNQIRAEEILRGVAGVHQEINRDNGINGKSLQVVIANDNNDPDLAQEVAHKFVKDPAIFAVVGHNTSNATVAAVPIYRDGKLVMLSPTSFSTDMKHPAYIFRMVPQISFFASQLSKSIDREISDPKIAVCLQASLYNESLKREFNYVVSAFKGQKIDLDCNLSVPNFNPSNLIEAMRKNKANSLIVAPHSYNVQNAIALFKAVRESQLPIKLYGTTTFHTEQTLKLGGEAVEGLTLSVPYYPDAKEKDAFRSLWQAELNTWRTTMAGDATRAIATALQQLLLDKNPSRDQLDNILRSPNFKVKGVTGEFKFNSNTGEREFLFHKQRSDALIIIENGQFVKIE